MGEDTDAEGDTGAAASQQRLDELLNDPQSQAVFARSPRDRVDPLLEAVLAVGSDLDLGVVLQQIVQSAADLVDARYGALGVIGEENGLSQFITVGMGDETIEQIGPYPQGRGILGLLIREPHSLRLVDLGEQPDASGFPAGHPPMRTFLGAPVRVREKVFGNLYLTEKRGGAEFGADDEAVLVTLAVAAGVAIDNARLYDAVQRRERWLMASGELTRALLSGIEPAEVLRNFTATVLEMADADVVTLAVPVPRTGNLVIEAAAGTDANRALGLVLSHTTLAGKVYSSGETITTQDWNADPRAERDTASTTLGPVFLVPLGTPEHVRGVLQVARHCGRPAFSDAAVAMIAGFANHAALALEIAGHRHDAERLLVLTDRDRIARDLHDLAIQRLFASGLSLQSTLAQVADRPRVAERIARVVDDLDDTIKVIRSTIYGLQQRGRPEDTGLRSRLVAESNRASEALGFAPALRMTGLLDTLVPQAMADHLLAVLREALANAARHADATEVEITAQVTSAHLTLRVTDNGRGTAPARAHRSGLANLHTRAEELGGALVLAPNQPTGSVVDWSVPLSADE